MIDSEDEDVKELNDMIAKFHEHATALNSELDGLCEEIGSMVRICMGEGIDGVIMKEKFVEIHNKIRGIYSTVGEYYDNFKYKYNKMRERCMKITDECLEKIRARRLDFKKVGMELRKASKTSRKRKKLLEQEYEIFGNTMDIYHTALMVATLMRNIDAGMHLVLMDLTEILGKMEGLTRIVETMLSGADTAEIRKRLEEFHREREQDIKRYIF